MNRQPGVIIAGASVRAAAASAVRADYQVYAVDLFGDGDLREIAHCDVVPSEEYPQAIADIMGRLPLLPWCYTGALENRPALVEAISKHRPLLGNCAETLRQVRDPFALSATLRKHHLPSAEVLPALLQTSPGQWIRKPLASAGGGGVVRLNASGVQRPTSRQSCFFQQYIEGESHSGVYVMAGRQSALLGVTRQLHGSDFGTDTPFGYVGSIGPLHCSGKLLQQWQHIGAVAAEAFDLNGVVGIDAIVAPDGDVYVVEVNPRFTASMELFERTCDNLFTLHQAACSNQVLPAHAPCNPPRTLAGKAIAFAGPSAVEIAPAFSRYCLEHSTGNAPQIADVPLAGQQIQPGHPIATVFAQGESVKSVEKKLRDSVADLLRRAN